MTPPPSTTAVRALDTWVRGFRGSLRELPKLLHRIGHPVRPVSEILRRRDLSWTTRRTAVAVDLLERESFGHVRFFSSRSHGSSRHRRPSKGIHSSSSSPAPLLSTGILGSSPTVPGAQSNPSVEIQKRQISSFERNRLESLEEDANDHPQDPAKQARFLHFLNTRFPEYVKRRVESGRFAVNEDVEREYRKSLELLGLDPSTHAQLPDTLYQTQKFHPGQQNPAYPQNLPLGSPGGIPAPPSGTLGNYWTPPPPPQLQRNTSYSFPSAQQGSAAAQQMTSYPPPDPRNRPWRDHPRNPDEEPEDPRSPDSPHYYNPKYFGMSNTNLPPPKSPFSVVGTLFSLLAKLFNFALSILLFYLISGWVWEIWKSRQRPGQSNSGGPMSAGPGILGGMFGSTKKYEIDTTTAPVYFKDVQGIDECKEEVMELVQFLRNPEAFQSFGGKMPAGILLSGPPGTGKTMLAKAMASEAGVPMLYVSGSEFEEMFVGVGARRVRDLFEEAREKSPCIVFMDELDGIGGRRVGMTSSTPNGTLNQMLTEMDGFRGSEGILVIAATNRPQDLDSALTRPGRFDKKIEVPLPDVFGRARILKTYLKKVKLAEPVDAMLLARNCIGFSGAELANLVNIAAVNAVSRKLLAEEKGMGGTAGLSLEGVTNKDVDEARERIIMGLARTSARVSDMDKKLTAYHEGGHTIAALFTRGATPLYKVTILPRGPAGGVTHFIPDDDQHFLSKEQLLANLVVALGGRVAEEMIFGEDKVTTGPSSDLQKATQLARRMVAQLGMGQTTGLAVYGVDGSVGQHAQELIDAEVRRLLDEANQTARRILEDNADKLHLLAEALLKYETLSAEEVGLVIEGKPIHR